ncbi:dual specificity protein phosphatase 22-B isoform X2 [Betta splendens]|uniref:Dual specificity protein phosphatase 22-B isoform X2 n=1 Tax=Betta splendens TaxID=158456 RepID=A0A9W2XE82_BETSP|nr:dual specificity protein phosphatase 22-B isoform X2 [Betta splendens]
MASTRSCLICTWGISKMPETENSWRGTTSRTSCPFTTTQAAPSRTQHFKQSIMFMHESRLKGEGCLVHCLAGVSRSVTLVVAYIMTVTGLGWQQALAAVKAARPCAGPNVGFQQQLQDFEATQAAEFRKWFQMEYKDNPFDDEAHIQDLLSRASEVRGGRRTPPPDSV